MRAGEHSGWVQEQLSSHGNGVEKAELSWVLLAPLPSCFAN